MKKNLVRSSVQRGSVSTWKKVALLVLFLSFCRDLAADTLTIEATRDNTLYEPLPGSEGGLNSNGAGPAFFAGVNGKDQIHRGLLSFDLSAIPAGSTIQSVTLSLNQSNTLDMWPGPQLVGLHRVARDWGEGASTIGNENGGGGPGAPAQAGDATWLHTFFPDQFWQSPGGDFEGTASASLSVMGNGLYVLASTPQLVADVQGWIDVPASNFGWVLIGNETTSRTAKRFDSRSVTDPSHRPLLTVEFLSGPAPGKLQFALPVVSAGEDEGTLMVRVLRSSGSEGEVSVEYSAMEQSALEGEDYQPLSGQLTFAGGETEKSFPVNLLDDDVFEGEESLILQLSNPLGGASLGTAAQATLVIDDEEDLTHQIYFAQYGEGEGLTSRLTLLRADPETTAHVRIVIRRDDGSPYPARLNGESLPLGIRDLALGPGSTVVLTSDVESVTPPEGGSVSVFSDREVAGVILFGGNFGLAGISSSISLPGGFMGPIETDSASATSTGIAVQNLEEEAVVLTLELLDPDGNVLAQAETSLVAGGHAALFVEQFDWDSQIDFSRFQGAIRVSTSGIIAAVMIEVRGTARQFATLPVVPRPALQ